MSSFKTIIQILKEKNKKISTMESCTGGAVANEITNIEGASDVFEFSAVTYSNHFKIKMGVDSKIIEKYTVYSIETAKEMSKKISIFSGSDYGIGITGKLNRVDKNNLFGDNSTTYISIYDTSKKRFYTSIVQLTEKTRKASKKRILEEIEKLLLTVLK